VATLLASGTVFGCSPRAIVLEGISATFLRAPSDRDEFFNIVAVNFQQPALCDRIDARADASTGGWDSPYRIRRLRSVCRDDVKGATITTPHAMGIAAERSPFVRYMRLLGYDDARVAADRWKENPYLTETHAAYERLRTDGTFIERLRTAPNFFEPPSAGTLRPARAAEFLYQMVAIDAEDANLCAKVSPNATFTDLYKRTALLRSRCFVSIAYNTKNDALCAELPRIGTFPHVNDQYDSREACEYTVAVYKRPGFNRGGLRDGPSAFPRPSDFQDALQQIGYPQDARSRVPAPTPEDYWLFLSRMKYKGSDDDRRELLRKVMALR
jgi:hypothetical protein